MLSQPIVLQYDEDLHAGAGAYTYKKLRAIIAAALFVIQTILRKRQEFRIFRKSLESEKDAHQNNLDDLNSGRIVLLTKYMYIYIRTTRADELLNSS